MAVTPPALAGVQVDKGHSWRVAVKWFAQVAASHAGRLKTGNTGYRFAGTELCCVTLKLTVSEFAPATATATRE